MEKQTDRALSLWMEDAFRDKMFLRKLGINRADLSQLFDQVNDKMEPFGILMVQKPLSRPLFYQALHLLIATQNRWQRFDRENQKLRTKMEEVRIVARAKCILVEYLRMSEQQAHRYIEKQAMDMRTSKKDVAENILKTYT